MIQRRQVVVFEETHQHHPYAVVLHANEGWLVIQRVTTRGRPGQRIELMKGDPRHEAMGFTADIVYFYENDVKEVEMAAVRAGKGEDCPLGLFNYLLSQSMERVEDLIVDADARARETDQLTDFQRKLLALAEQVPDHDVTPTRPVDAADPNPAELDSDEGAIESHLESTAVPESQVVEEPERVLLGGDEKN